MTALGEFEGRPAPWFSRALILDLPADRGR